jgi:hypothetical protein
MVYITLMLEEQICNLYKTGMSGREVAASLGITISRVYRTLKAHPIELRTMQDYNKTRFISSPLSFSLVKKTTTKQRELTIAGLMLYFAEGAKTGVTVDFANSSPALVKLFLNFLREVCQIDENRVRLYLYCFANQDVNYLVHYWSEYLKVSSDKFTKPYIKKTLGQQKRIMKYGLLHVRYSDKRLLESILSLGDDVLKQFVKG